MHRSRDTQIYRLYRQIDLLRCGFLLHQSKPVLTPAFAYRWSCIYISTFFQWSTILSFHQYKTVTTLPSRSCLFSQTTPVLIILISLLFITFRKILKYEKGSLTIPISSVTYVHRQPFHRQITSALQTVRDNFRQGSRQNTRYDFISF